MASRVIQTPESLPVPRDEEERRDYVDRFVTHARVRQHPLARRYKLADDAWAAAKSRCRVSVKNAVGEFLLFD